MARTFHRITPTEGARVRDEHGQLVTGFIDLAELTPYWVRRQADKEVEIEAVTLEDDPPPAEEAPAAETASTETPPADEAPTETKE
jgi:hypothetical protein